jgi:pimeloyl-ACP methyl ester carboxylesterase
MNNDQIDDSGNDQKHLFFRELNNDAQTTIVLVHGAGSAGSEWSLVTPYLNDYHILLPDLPAHGGSQTISPFSKELSVRMLADLIKKHARHSKAHIIGHSLGATIAIELASHHANIVDTVIVSGYGKGSSPKSLGYALWVQSAALSAAPTSAVKWLMDGADLPPLATSNSLALNMDIAKSICSGPDAGPSPWPARTLIIAAGKSGLLPTADSPTAAMGLRDIGRTMNKDTVAFTHPKMRHPWNRQDPQLYAQMITQWIEKGTVPEGFRSL